MKPEHDPLDLSKVPEFLHRLMPWVERFGVPDYVEVAQAPDLGADDMLRFWMAVQPHAAEIHGWLDSTEQSPETEAFTYMMLALDYADPDCEAQEMRRRQSWETTVFPNAIADACRMADEAFRLRDYKGVVAVLTPFERHLERVHVAKLHYARTHV